MIWAHPCLDCDGSGRMLDAFAHFTDRQLEQAFGLTRAQLAAEPCPACDGTGEDLDQAANLSPASEAR